MADFNLQKAQNSIDSVQRQFNPQVITTLVSTPDLLNPVKNDQLRSLLSTITTKLINLIREKRQERIAQKEREAAALESNQPLEPEVLKPLTIEEEEYDIDKDGILSAKEKRTKFIADFKKELNEQVFQKYGIDIEGIEFFLKSDKESRKNQIVQFVKTNPKYLSTSGSIEDLVKKIDRQIETGKELFSIFKKGDMSFVEGQVVDSKTNLPIKGALVTFTDSSGETLLSYTDRTNKNGEFTIEIPQSPSTTPPLPPLTPEQQAVINAAIYVQFGISSPSNITSSFSSTTNTPSLSSTLIPISGSVNIPLPFIQDPPETITTTTTTNADGSSTVTTTNTTPVFTATTTTTVPAVTQSGAPLSETSPTNPTPQTEPAPTIEEIDVGVKYQQIGPEQLSGFSVYVAKNIEGDPYIPAISTLTGADGGFLLNAPEDFKYIGLSKNNAIYTTYTKGQILTGLSDLNIFEVPYDQFFADPPSTEVVKDSTNINSGSGGGILNTNRPVDTIKVIKTGLKNSYATVKLVPYKGDGSVKEKLLIRMDPLDLNFKQTIQKLLNPNKQDIDAATQDKKDAKWYQQEKLGKVARDLAKTLTPAVIALIVVFGLSNVDKLIEEGKGKLDDIQDEISCPTTEGGQAAQDRIKNIIAKKNKLTKQLNNVLNIIESTNSALGIAATSIEVLNSAYLILKNIPTPTSTGVPGTPGLPINVINSIQDNKDKIDKTINTLRKFNTGLVAILGIIRNTLKTILQYLNLLDNLIQFCSPDNEEEQVAISAELTALTQESTSPIVTNVNGFVMSVETEKTTNSLKRRRALASNSNGIVLLQGEWSFSSIDQILIDELVFYIKINNLKAY
jgi:hypothetical protein